MAPQMEGRREGLTEPGTLVVAQTLREVAKTMRGFRFRLEWMPAGDLTLAQRRERECRLDLMASLQTMNSRTHAHLATFSWGMTNLVVVVPANLGRKPGLLHELTVEFTPGLW